MNFVDYVSLKVGKGEGVFAVFEAKIDGGVGICWEGEVSEIFVVDFPAIEGNGVIFWIGELQPFLALVFANGVRKDLGERNLSG